MRHTLTKNLLVNVECQTGAATLHAVSTLLSRLGEANQLQGTLFLVSTNVTPKGVRSAVRQVIGDDDTVVVAITSQIV
jgi:hypothetical protein